MNGNALSEEWRTSDDGSLRRRRAIIGLSLLNIMCMGMVASYQTGISREIPDLDDDHFDTPKVIGASEAYSILSTPDGILGLSSFAGTAALAAAGGGINRPACYSVLLALKSLLDLTAAALLTYYEVKRVRALCSLCLTTTVSVSFVAVLALFDFFAAGKRHERIK